MADNHDKKHMPRRTHHLPVRVPLSKGVLIVNERLCTGCMICMYTCTLNKDGVAAPEIARIQLNAYSHHIFDIAAQPCLQCVQPECLRYCPQGAIHIDEISGTNARIIDEKKCIGCLKCIEVCPFTPPRIRFDSIKKKAVKCDLCGGDPKCVKACPIGALAYYTNNRGVMSGHGAGGV